MGGFENIAVVCVLALHLAWILWVILGARWTRGRPLLAAFHIASLLWGIVVEIGPWDCPLTLAEQFFRARAGLLPYSGSFLMHGLGRIVYPDLSVEFLTVCGLLVCGVNLAIYGRRYWRWRRKPFHSTKKK
ncbi:MAG: DUF2784 domain-containing protein [Acidobacteriaceae bacterium]